MKDEKKRQPRGRLIAMTLVLCGVGTGLLFLVAGSIPLGYVKGRVIGKAEKVVITDPLRGLVVEGHLQDDGSFSCPIPRTAREPMIVIHGPSKSLVRSLPFEPEDTELPVMALWTADIRIRSEDGVLRFDWAPVPSTEGFPSPLRYSVLVAYTKENGDRGEASLIAHQPFITLPVAELKDYLNEWDPEQPDTTLTLRAFKLGEIEGALWVAGEQAWRVPD